MGEPRARTPPIKRRRSALFYLGVGSAADLVDRCFLQVRYCQGGIPIRTELITVALETLLRDAVTCVDRNTRLYIDSSSFHEPWRGISSLRELDDICLTVRDAVSKFGGKRFLVDRPAPEVHRSAVVTPPIQKTPRTPASAKSKTKTQTPKEVLQLSPSLERTSPRKEAPSEMSPTQTDDVTLLTRHGRRSYYSTIVVAAKAAVSGDTVIIPQGVYRTECIELQEGVVLRAADDVPRESVVLIAKNISMAAVRIRGSNVVVKGLTIVKNRSIRPKHYPSVVDVDSNLSGILLLNCVVNGGVAESQPQSMSRCNGVFFDARSSGRVENCVVEWISLHAIVTNPDGLVEIVNTEIRHSLNAGLWVSRRLAGSGTKACVFLSNTTFIHCLGGDVDATPESRVSFLPLPNNDKY
uniref:Right handed beta helix domain-containing protein n=1 Tax=Spongospora subterranea TaxID=70186 RepID=A0A0H5R8V6_9EUKA|eukprot:CRZ10221.1 hypothetical protein [Spongospora subterranea]